MVIMSFSGKTPAWWNVIHVDKTTPPPPSTPATLMDLPGELRNMIYDILANETEHVTIRNGKLLPHPLVHVNRQIKMEFGTLFDVLPTGHMKSFAPQRITLQIQDYDFKSAVDALNHCVVTPGTRFDIHVRVTKQLYRCEWEQIWPWIEYCDILIPTDGYQGTRVRSKFSVELELAACNPYAASHELYVEAMPYILRGAGGPGGLSAGYEEIAKMRAALRGAISNDSIPQHGSDEKACPATMLPW